MWKTEDSIKRKPLRPFFLDVSMGFDWLIKRSLSMPTINR